MRRLSLSLSLLIAAGGLLSAAGDARALGFGRSLQSSYLGQPLNFAAVMRLEPDESLPSECVTAEVLSGDFRVAPAAVRVSVEPAPNPSERYVRVSTTSAVDEPVVTVKVTVGCQQRMTRSFVALIDPPGINLAGATVAAADLPPQRVAPETAPVVALVQPAESASTPRRARPMPEADAGERARVASGAAPVRARPAPQVTPPKPRERKPRPAPPSAVARSAGPRLQLEPGSAAVATASAAAASAAAAQAAAEAASEVAASNMAAASAVAAASAAQQRVASLEDQMRVLREESQKTQKALAALQSNLAQAQDTRYANWLVYALAALSALLALAVALLWWRQSKPRQNSQWWLAPTGTSVPAAQAVPKPTPARAPTDALASRHETQPAVMSERPLEYTLSGETLAPPAAPEEAPVSVIPPGVAESAKEPRRELSVEELIDLEQQADFFIVLGQEDAAVDLLMGHVRSSGGASPLPYLKLLEIYRRRGDHDAYERVRERFNRRFSAYAPEWGSDLAHGRSLEDYPEMMRQLQRLWDEPIRVTQMLDAALMRQDGEGGGETYDLPAYRELLFLYSVARDLGEHPSNARAVDLELPMDGSAEKPIEELTASRLMGFAPTNQLTVQVDLDVTRPMPENPKSGASDFMGLIDPGAKRGGEPS